ncbi:MAG: InlB B-repeat-containing protein [Lawsonibacter sp.]
MAYLLNGEKDAPNGPWYQNLTGPNADPYPVLDPTHAAVYLRNGVYVNATYSSITSPTITTDGGISLVELVSKLPQTVTVHSTIGDSTADVTWNTDNIHYDPEDFNAQTFTVNGTANVTGLLNGGEKAVTATVNVNAVTVNGLTVTTAPNLTYSQGGKLDLGGVKATANLSNGKAQIVEHDTEGVTFALDGQTIEDGASLDKAQHNGKTLTLSYGGQTVDLGTLAVRSTNNFISALTVSGQEAQYENGGYAVTLPPYSSLPSADGITVTLADPSAKVTGKTQISAGDSEARWQITVQAENGDPATYLLTVTVSPDYDLLNQTAVNEFTAAWNSLGEISWTPTQAEVQQDTTTAGATWQEQLTFWLTNQLFEAGLNIPDNATLEITYTSGPDWATAGTRQDHDGTPGSFTFTATFTATAGEESQYKSVSFADNVGAITPTPYDAPAYTVYFDPQNGSAVSSVQVTEDTPIEEPDAPTRADYRFTGWYKEATCETLWDFSDKVEQDNMTLYAGWRWSQSHTEIGVERTQAANQDAFDAGEYGEGPRMGDTVTITAQATLTEEPGQTNTWNADPETFTFYLGDPESGGELLDEVTATEEGGVYTAELKVDLTDEAGFAEGENTIYAVFSGGDQLDGSRASESLNIGKAMFTVTFSNTGDSEIENQYVEDGETASRPSDPTWEDYRFTGWKDGEQDFDFGEEITGNTDLTATWEWARSDTGVSIRLEQPGNPDAPTKTGVYHIGDDVSIHASVKLAEQPEVSNGINLTPNTFAFYVGDPDNGGTHLGTVEASVDGDGYTATLENITLGTTEGLTDVGGYDIYAVFTGSDELNASREHTSLTVRPRLYTVTFDSDGGSTIKPQYVEDGGTIEEPEAPTRQDYRFTGWADEDGSPYDFSTTVTGPVELTATWEWSKSETGVSIMWVSAGNDAAGENGTPIRMGDTVSITASVELAAQSNSMFLSVPEFVFYVGDPDHGGTSLGTVSAQQTERGYTATLENITLGTTEGLTDVGNYDIYAVFSGSSELDESRSYAELDVEPAIYTVKFNSKEGTPVDTQYIVDGQTITEPEEPTQGGYNFGGWEQESGQLWNFAHDTVTHALTLTARWTRNPVFDIDGSVTDNENQPLANIQITLQRGNEVVFRTETDSNGHYEFKKVSPGLYNIVAERTVGQDGQQTKQTVTTLVEIIDHNAAAPTIKMPPENVNSVLELPQDAPNIMVGGLTEEAIAVAEEDENQGATVTVNMKVEPKAPVTGTPEEDSEAAQLQQEQQAIQQQAASRTLDFLEIAVVKEVTNSGSTNTTPITETSNILEIAVEFDFGNRENVTVYRYHDGKAQALTQVNARTGANQDGTYYLDRANNLIHIFTQQFSLYAIGYTVPTPGGDTGGGGGGVSTYRITVEDSEHGEVKSSRASASQGSTVTLTVKPNEGYELSELIVTDSRGNEIDLTDKGNGKFTFTMPGRAVTVEAIFAEIEEEPQPWNNPFVDVRAGAWYYDAVRYVHEHGLMAGTSAKTFDPNVITTRGMIVTILYRLAGSPDIENRNWGYPYADVDSTAYYGTAVYWARLCGIVAGYSRDLFGPNDPITREQFAVMLYRFAGQPSAPDPTLTFSDADQVSGYASDAMRWAVGAGIISGKGNGILDPKGDATRAQAAAMLMRFCQKYMEK